MKQGKPSSINREENRQMARYRTISLSEAQKQALTSLRDQTKEEYVRERCAALLKIEAGETAHRVAQSGLLRQFQDLN
jgi:hypothetical protein